MQNTFAEAIQRLKRQLPFLPKALHLVIKASGAVTAVWLILIIVQGLLPVAMVYLTRFLVDGVASAIATKSGWPALLALAPAGLAMMLAWFADEACRSVAAWLRSIQTDQVQDHIHGLIHDQTLRLDMACLDSPDYYDQLHRARFDALTRPAALLENVGALVQGLVTLAAMAAVLCSFGGWLPLLLILSAMPALAIVMRHAIRFHQWQKDQTHAIRRAAYYDMFLTQREMAAEMRLFGLGPYFKKLFRAQRNMLRRDQARLAGREAIGQALAAAIGITALAGALAWMLRKAASGSTTIGGLALFYQAFFQGQRIMRALLSQAGEIYRNMLFLENLFDFLALEPAVHDSHVSTFASTSHNNTWEFKNVDFCYPNSIKPVLTGFNLVLPAGCVTAIVGENGAGKSTLAKLLCRFYDPLQGQILMDGEDIRNIPVAALRRRITALFQEPVHYQDTVRDNIAFGDLDSVPDQRRIEAAAVEAAADTAIERLPKAYNAMLGKWFGGAELSPGEWQRIALARAFLRQAALVILDEPTGNMDSWSEADWLAKFKKLVAGRTAMIITHRFTTALHADIIHVLEQGKIVESGSHPELLALNGRYSASWIQQTQPGQALHNDR